MGMLNKCGTHILVLLNAYLRPTSSFVCFNFCLCLWFPRVWCVCVCSGGLISNTRGNSIEQIILVIKSTDLFNFKAHLYLKKIGFPVSKLGFARSESVQVSSLWLGMASILHHTGRVTTGLPKTFPATIIIGEMDSQIPT